MSAFLVTLLFVSWYKNRQYKLYNQIPKIYFDWGYLECKLATCIVTTYTGAIAKSDN